jgi:hypothetical protein
VAVQIQKGLHHQYWYFVVQKGLPLDLSSMYKYRNIQRVAVIFCELINPCYKFSVFVLNIDIFLDHLDKGTTAGHNNFSCIISGTFGQSTPFAAGNTTFGAAKPTGTALHVEEHFHCHSYKMTTFIMNEKTDDALYKQAISTY